MAGPSVVDEQIGTEDFYPKRTAVPAKLGDGKTTLDGQLNDQPWRNYQLGQGLNALSGGFAIPAVEPFEITDFPQIKSNTVVKTISSESTFESEFSAEMSASYNMTYHVEASASFLSDVSYSTTSFTLIATVDIESQGYGRATDVKLTPDAALLAETSPETFRNTYGDYFVSSYTSGARLVATYTCSTSTSKSLLEFAASIEGGSNVMSASGATKFKQAMSDHHVSVEVNLYLENTKPHPHFGSDVDAIVAALDWFQQVEDKQYVNLDMGPRRAQLTHFKALHNALPNVLDVDPEVFANIKALSFLVVHVNTLLQQLPAYYQTERAPSGETFGELVTKLVQTFNGAIEDLPNRPALVTELHDTAEMILEALSPVVAVVAFYNNIMSTPPYEGSKGENSQSFGYSPESGLPVEVLWWQDEFKHEWTVGHWAHDFDWPSGSVGSDQFVVGWAIWNRKGENPGSWSRANPFIGKSNGRVSVRSDYDRGIDWLFTAFYVKMSNFPWLVSGVSKPVRARRRIAQSGD